MVVVSSGAPGAAVVVVVVVDGVVVVVVDVVVEVVLVVVVAGGTVEVVVVGRMRLGSVWGAPLSVLGSPELPHDERTRPTTATPTTRRRDMRNIMHHHRPKSADL